MSQKLLHDTIDNFYDDFIATEDQNKVIELGVHFLAKMHMLLDDKRMGKKSLEFVRTSLEYYLFRSEGVLASRGPTIEKWKIFRRAIHEALEHLMADAEPQASLYALYDSFYLNFLSFDVGEMHYWGTEFLLHLCDAVESGNADLEEKRDGVSILEKLQEQSNVYRPGKVTNWSSPKSDLFGGYCEMAAEILRDEQKRIQVSKRLEAIMMGTTVPRLSVDSMLGALPEDVLRWHIAPTIRPLLFEKSA